MRPLIMTILLPGLLALAACTLRGTTESVTDATQNVTVSTSGRTWFTEDGLVRDDQKINAFVAINFDRLKQDLARGEGEYLNSFATLLNIPGERRAEFGSLMQARYGSLVPSVSTTPAELVAALDRVLL